MYYNEIAKGYEELHKEEQEKKVGLIKKLMEDLGWRIDSSSQVLDVGCGTGLTTECWNGTKTGLDPAQKLLEKARKQDPKSEYVLGKAEDLPFKEGSFDFVFSITALQNFDDLDKALSEVKRVGKDKFVLTFLKKSPKKKLIEEKIKLFFSVVQEIEEEKDMIYFLKR